MIQPDRSLKLELRYNLAASLPANPIAARQWLLGPSFNCLSFGDSADLTDLV